jgi:hypothetical protein
VWYPRGANGLGGNLIVVRDKITATLPHAYEFNMHARMPIQETGVRSVKIGTGSGVGSTSVCLSDLTNNTSVIPMPGGSSDQESHKGVTNYHKAFKLQHDGGASIAEFLVVLDIGCTNTPVVASGTAGNRTVTVGSQSYTFE